MNANGLIDKVKMSSTITFRKEIYMSRSNKDGWLYCGALTWLLLGFAMADLFGRALVQVSVPPCGLCNIKAV